MIPFLVFHYETLSNSNYCTIVKTSSKEHVEIYLFVHDSPDINDWPHSKDGVCGE